VTSLTATWPYPTTRHQPISGQPGGPLGWVKLHSQRCLTRLGRSQTNSGGARMGTWQTGRIDCPCRGAVRLALQICAVLVWFGQLAEV
jgi:hypothetical protein